jgi:hypothetical protein
MTLARQLLAGDEPQNLRLHESPPGRQGRWVAICLLMIVGLALGLRVWGIRFGLPYDFTYDEIHEIVRAFKLGMGEYYWASIGKGGLYYFLFVEYGLMYVIWSMMGKVTSTHDFAMLYFQDASPFLSRWSLHRSADGNANLLGHFCHWQTALRCKGRVRSRPDWRDGLLSCPVVTLY